MGRTPDHTSLRLALLNACEGAKGSDRDIFSSTAATLVRRGLPAVIAMQYPITDAAAIQFTQEFYGQIAVGQPIDGAVAEARLAMVMETPDSLEWATPVLYTHAADGRIFEMALSKKNAKAAAAILARPEPVTAQMPVVPPLPLVAAPVASHFAPPTQRATNLRYGWVVGAILLLAMIVLGISQLWSTTAAQTVTPTPDVTVTLTTASGVETPLPTQRSAVPTAATAASVAMEASPCSNATLRTHEPSNAVRINFGDNQASAVRNGTLAAGAHAYYVLGARENQEMAVEVTSPNHDVWLAIRGEKDGSPYNCDQNKGSSLHMTLPATQDYYVEVFSLGAATEYTLHVWIAPFSTQPENITFAPGTFSAKRDDWLPSGPRTLQYVLGAGKGQTMTVDVSSTGGHSTSASPIPSVTPRYQSHRRQGASISYRRIAITW